MATAQESSGTVTSATPAREVIQIGAPTVLRGVSYGLYVRLRDEPDNRHLRMTYYDGTLEIMSPEYIHEHPSFRFGLLFAVLCEELNITCEASGSTTFRRGEPRRKKGKGKEP